MTKTISRNDPCPCGSGRKYKKCHLAAETAERTAEQADVVSPFHALDEHLVRELLDFGGRRYPKELGEHFVALDSHPDISAQFAAPWLAYVARIQGRPLVERYLAERGWSLSRGAVEWLAAQQKSWLSVWEIVAVDPGRTMTLRDLLTHEERTVHEVGGSRMARPLDALLARVVDVGRISVMCGSHTVPLRPQAAAAVVERIRKVLRRRTAVPPERLRDPKIAERLLHEWSDAIDRLQRPPRLQNTDGDALLFTTDRWKFDDAGHEEIVVRVGAMDGAIEDDSGERVVFIFLRAADETVIGRVEVGEGSLVAETNSIGRADDLRSRIEEACDPFLRAHIRSHADPIAEWMRGPQDAAVPLPQPAPDEAVIIRQVKERYYAEWLDESIPALGGKTPREAVRTKSGREKLEVILKEIELAESTLPEAARYDVHELRRALGMIRPRTTDAEPRPL